MSQISQADEPHSERAALADKHVGLRIRERRITMGLSQQQLASMIGITYQQQHKYERGLNRIAAGRLFAIAQALGIEPAWFFDGMSADITTAEIPHRQRMHLELMRNFALIKDEKQQEAISTMARSLAGS